MIFSRICLIFVWNLGCLSYTPPHFQIKRLSTKPILSSWDNNSASLYNFNSAYIPTPNDPDAIVLLVRVGNLQNNPKDIYDVGPSKIAVSHSIENDPLRYSYINEKNILIDTDREYQSFGAEDPRVVYDQGTYYLFYTAVTKTTDLLHYKLTSKHLFETQKTFFDSELVEAGPEPLRLSDKNYLDLYNSARRTCTNHLKPNWALEYNLGWAILNGKNPTEVLARSDQPLLSPELHWEKCDCSSAEWKYRGLTPLVIFVEAWKQTAKDTFLVWYQGCDTVMGLAELKVHFSSVSPKNFLSSTFVYLLCFFFSLSLSLSLFLIE